MSVLTIKAVDMQNCVSSLAIGCPLQQTGRVGADMLRPDSQPLQTLEQTVLTHAVVTFWPEVRHKPVTGDRKATAAEGWYRAGAGGGGQWGATRRWTRWIADNTDAKAPPGE